MSNIHEIAYTVRPHETDYGTMMQPKSLLDYLQDAAYEHSIKLGFSVFDLFPKGLTWVLSRYHVKVDRFPGSGEQVRIHTWYPGPQKPFYLREWEILDRKGTVIVRATSSWLVVNIRSGKPVDGDEVLKELNVTDKRALEDDFIPLPGTGRTDVSGRFCVRLSDTDINRHVNHVHHILWALETVPPDIMSKYVPLEIEASYKGEIRLGQEITVHTEIIGEGFFNHRLVRESDRVEVARLRTRWGKKS
jgi:medium-chain acyl-[acyl-carrier-protein] hydrolase